MNPGMIHSGSSGTSAIISASERNGSRGLPLLLAAPSAAYVSPLESAVAIVFSR
jgi:hypothetical protein